MSNAYVIGAGMTKFGRYPDRSVEALAVEAIMEALSDAGLEWRAVQQMYAAHVQQGVAAGQRILKEIGPTGIPVLNVENCAAAGATAIREASHAIRAGAYDVIVVVGFEKMQPGVLLNVTPESDPNVVMGMTVLPMRYSLMAMSHMAQYGTTVEQFAEISVKNHDHAVHNRYAQHPKPLSLEQVLSSRMICDPITVLQCSPVSDGAAAVVMCSESFLARHGRGREVQIRASSLKSDIDLPARNLHTADLIQRTAEEAYERAGLGPGDMDVVEVHDCFSVAELLSYEALGLCAPGEGGRMVDEGATRIDGRIPVNPSGGLLARGHPLGATGVAQVVEIVSQLRGEAEQRQVDKPRVGLAYNAGIMSACVTILGN
jgi:acetyl-CoA acetyltransferase